MQVVGRECVRCEQRIRNDLEAVGCADCDLAVHDACVARGATYREASPTGERRRKKAPRSTPCPQCGVDLRARKREEDRERAKIHADAEGERRAAAELRGNPFGPFTVMALQLAFALVFLSLAAIYQLFIR